MHIMLNATAPMTTEKVFICRERADWIVGMYAARLFLCLCGNTLQLVDINE